jgi:predicted RNase H-like HicB family nuclease
MIEAISAGLDINHGGARMRQIKSLTAIIERENDGYVALCPELDIASQGESIEEARKNLLEALELFFEAADPNEIKSRMHEEVFVTRLEVAVG